MKRALWLMALGVACVCAKAAEAAPTMTVGTATGAAGSSVSLSINFDPVGTSVAGIEFDLTLPASISSGTVTPGSILNTASKSVSTSLNGTTWRFIVFGLNQSTINAGTLLTAQLNIAANAAGGTLSLPVGNVTYSDANGNTITSGTNTGGSITVTSSLPPAPVVNSATSATGTTGTAFSYQITATNSPTSFNATNLPTGLSINTGTGLISGTPSVAGTSNITLSATNAGGTGTASLTLTVNPAAPVINSATSATGTAGTAFSYQMTATNSPTSFNATNLPTGLSINTGTGLISGTPSGAGTSNVTLSATNAGGTGTAALTLTINPAKPVINSAATATGTTGAAFSYQMTATNSPTSFNATNLPAGLSINTATGLISGTPSAAGTSNITLSATNAGGTGTAALTLTVNPAAPVINSATSATGTAGTAFSYQITATNSPTSFNATNLPTGLSINTATGLISGTPSATGTSNLTLSATNAGGTGTTSLTLTINAALPGKPVITSATSATGTAGTTFSYQIIATNSPTSFNATNLPTGLSINTATGLISGTPSAAGTSNVSLSATNAGGTGTASLTLTINPAAPMINSATSASGTAGTAFSYQITATNNPTSFNATNLPTGLSVNTATGLISGTPSATGTSNVTLSATNAGGTGTTSLTLTINAALPGKPVITSATSATGTAGTGFSYQIVATNNPTSFNATNLPTGLSINTGTGLISGTPSAAGTSNITLSATNAGGTGSASLTLTVNPAAPVINSATSATGTAGTAFSYQITATNSPSSFNATNLPTGLSINTGTGLISGTPSVAGTSNVTLSATNSGGTGTAALTLTVNAALPSKPAITSATSATGTSGTAFSYQITASNSPTSFNATGLPSGLSINTGTGLISGTPSAAGTSNVTLSAINAGGTGTATLALTINPTPVAPTLSVGSGSGAAGSTVNLPFTFNTGNVSVAGMQFDLTLPAGLSTGSVTAGSILNSASKSVSTNLLSGNTWRFIIFGLNQTPVVSGNLLTAQMAIGAGTAAGNLSITISNASFTDINGNTLTSGSNTGGTVTVTASAPVVTQQPQNITVTAGQTAGFSVTATGATSYQWQSKTSSASSFSTISGATSSSYTTPATSTSNSGTQYECVATGPGGSVTSNAATLTVNALVVSPVISAFTASPTSITQGNSSTLSWTVSGATSLSISPTVGTVTGSAIVVGPTQTTTYTLTATNSAGSVMATAVVTVTVPVLSPVINSATSATGTAGSPFNYQITATNSPSSFNATGLPTGLSVNTGTGLISGTPSVAATSNVTLSATNTGGTGTATLSLKINSASAGPSLSVGTASGAAGTMVSLPITFNTSNSSVAGMQFDLTLPATLSTTAVTAGSILNSTSKSVSTSFMNGNTWRFLVFGLNQSAIASGSLLTAQMTIVAGTPAGNLPVTISNTSYSDINGNTLAAGPSTSGSVTVTASASLPVITQQPQNTTVASGQTATFSVTAAGATSYQWQSKAAGAASFSAIAGANSAIYTTPAVSASNNGTQYECLASNSAGSATSNPATLTVNSVVNPMLPLINSFTASPTSIPAGSSGPSATSYLGWSVTNATTLSIDNGIGNVTTDYEYRVAPSVTTTYTLTATNSAGSVTATVTITVGSSSSPSVPMISQQPQNMTVSSGQTASFSVSATNATSYQWQSKAAGGSSFTSISGATGASYTTPANTSLMNGMQFQCIVSNSAGQVTSQTASLTVTAAAVQPIITSFSANPTSITAGQSASLAWNVSGATSVSINGIGSVASVGTQTVTPSQTTTYTLTAASSAGSVSAQVTVVVTISPQATVPTVIFAPSSAAQGQTITITGSGFLATNVLYMSSPGTALHGIKMASSDGRTLTFVLNPATQYPLGLNTMYISNANGQSNTFTMMITPASGAHSAEVSTDLSNVQIYPSPWRSNKDAGLPITFAGLTANSTIKIFTVSGRLVKTISAVGGLTPWNLDSDSGDQAASGIYLYLITDDQGNKTHGKLAVIR